MDQWIGIGKRAFRRAPFAVRTLYSGFLKLNDALVAEVKLGGEMPMKGSAADVPVMPAMPSFVGVKDVGSATGTSCELDPSAALNASLGASDNALSTFCFKIASS